MRSASSQPALSPAKRGSLMRELFEHRGATLFALVLVAACGYLGYLHMMSNVLLVTVLTGVVVYEFALRVDQGLPLMQIGAVLACLQWLVGPIISFLSSSHHDRYFMYVSEDDYFGFALPGTAAYVVGLLGWGISIRQRPALLRVDRSSFVRTGVILNVVALGADIAGSRAPGGLAFFLHLISQLHYVGALYFLLSTHKWKWVLIGLSCFHLFLESTESGMFHDMILWSIVLFAFWFATQRRKTFHKVMVILIALSSVTLIQLTKQSMREKQHMGYPATFGGELVSLLTGHSDAASEDAFTLAGARLNQGWIVSAVIANVPRYEPFCEGETVVDAFLSSAVPRFLWSEKKRAGGQENFRRFTGMPLEDTTSMGISLLGESYANFGMGGGIVFMGVMGFLFSLSFYFLSKRVLKHPTFLFWIPLIYYQAIKAETELVVVVNQVVKGSIVAIAGYWVCVHYVLHGAGRPPARRSDGDDPEEEETPARGLHYLPARRATAPVQVN